MSLPVDLNTITVTGSFPNIAGQPQSGSVVFDPGGQVTDTVGHVIMSGAVTAHVFNGVMQAVTLPCTDNGNLNPTGFTYEVTATIDGTKYTPFAVLLPHTLGATVDLAVLVPVSSNPGTSTVYGVLALPNTWTGVNTFTAETVVPTPVNSGDAATKAYVDGHGAVSSVFTRTGAVVAASGDYTVGQVTGAAPLASPALTGSPTAPTQAPGDNTANVATDAFVTAAVGVETTRAQSAEGLALAKASNLSDLGNAATARTNLGLGSAAVAAIDSTAGDFQAVPGTAAAGATGKVADAGHVHPSPTVFAPTGLTGATAASRYAGATASGSPASGTFVTGDYVIAQNGAAFVCTAGGTPGTWKVIPTLNVSAVNVQPSPGTAAAGAASTGAPCDHVHGQPPMFAPTGLTGATTASRYVGATASGAPASGTFAVGDFVVDQGASAIWVCKFAGTPGTWKKLGQIDSTSTDIQPLGTQAAGSVGQTADAGHVHPANAEVTPADAGFLAWNYDIGELGGSQSVLTTAGVMYLIKVNVRVAISVTNVSYYVFTAGATLTSGQCFAGLYNSAGTLIGTSADQSAAWTSTGLKTTALTGGPFAVSAGFVWVAFLFNGTTAPSLVRNGTPNGNILNSGFTVSTARFASSGSALTSLPSTITPGSNTLNTIQWWVAIS